MVRGHEANRRGFSAASIWVEIGAGSAGHGNVWAGNGVHDFSP